MTTLIYNKTFIKHEVSVWNWFWILYAWGFVHPFLTTKAHRNPSSPFHKLRWENPLLPSWNFINHSKHCLGSYKAWICNLKNESAAEQLYQLNLKNITYLFKVFELEECYWKEFENHISVILNSADSSIYNCNELNFLIFLEKLMYLHRQHCLKTTRQYLDPDDKWWIVNCFPNTIDKDVKQAIYKHYFNAVSFSDRDIFHNI